MTHFVPPTYGNIGKNFRDLWSKKFENKSFLKVVTKAPSGLTVTSNASIDNGINGNLTAKYVDNSWGDVDTELDSTSGKAYATANFTKLVDGGKASLSGGLLGSKKPGDKNSLSFKAAFEESQESFTVAGSADFAELEKGDGFGAKINASATIGMDGITVGGEVKGKVDHEHHIDDHNFAAQFQKDNFTASMTTEKKGEIIKTSYYYTPSKEYTVGAEFVTDGTTDTLRKVLNVASQCECNPDTTAKFRWSSCGDFGAALERRLRNPNVALLVSANFKVKGTTDIRVDKFGVGFTFGDY